MNLNDNSQNQITFQPSINTTSEFKIDNSTYSAEYGRSSGSIVNVLTRSGTNAFHGEVFDYNRNNSFDTRNFFNPKGTAQNALKRNNFGAALGGPIFRDKAFFFGSYEGLRQHQTLVLNSGTLTAAQRQGGGDGEQPDGGGAAGVYPGTECDGCGERGAEPVCGQRGGAGECGPVYGRCFVPAEPGQPAAWVLCAPGGCAYGADPAGQYDCGVWRPPQRDAAGGDAELLPYFFADTFKRSADRRQPDCDCVYPEYIAEPDQLRIGDGLSGNVGLPQISITDAAINLVGLRAFRRGARITLGCLTTR